MKYPCKNCLIILVGCKQLCSRIELDDDKLFEKIKKTMTGDKFFCPDCGEYKWDCYLNIFTCCYCNHKFLGWDGKKSMFKRWRYL